MCANVSGICQWYGIIPEDDDEILSEAGNGDNPPPSALDDNFHDTAEFLAAMVPKSLIWHSGWMTILGLIFSPVSLADIT